MHNLFKADQKRRIRRGGKPKIFVFSHSNNFKDVIYECPIRYFSDNENEFITQESFIHKFNFSVKLHILSNNPLKR